MKNNIPQNKEALVEELNKVHESLSHAISDPVAFVMGYVEDQRKKNPNQMVDLSEVNLTGLNFSGKDLSYVDLSYADLQWANLDNANLEGAKGITVDVLKKAKSFDGVILDDDSIRKEALQQNTVSDKKEPSKTGNDLNLDEDLLSTENDEQDLTESFALSDPISINPVSKKRGFFDGFKKKDEARLELRNSRNSGFEDEESEDLNVTANNTSSKNKSTWVRATESDFKPKPEKKDIGINQVVAKYELLKKNTTYASDSVAHKITQFAHKDNAFNKNKDFKKTADLLKKNMEVIEMRMKDREKNSPVRPGDEHLTTVMDLTAKSVDALQKFSNPRTPRGERNAALRDANKYADLAARYIDKARLGGLGTHEVKKITGESVKLERLDGDVTGVIAKGYFGNKQSNDNAANKLETFKATNQKLLNNKTFAPRIREMEDNLARIKDAWQPGVNDEEAVRAWKKVEDSMSKLEKAGDASFFTRGKILKEVDTLLKEAKTYAGYAAGPSDEPLVVGKEPNAVVSFFRNLVGKSTAPKVTREEKHVRQEFQKAFGSDTIQEEFFKLLPTGSLDVTPQSVAEKLKDHSDKNISDKAKVFLELQDIENKVPVKDEHKGKERRQPSNEEFRGKVEKMSNSEKQQIRNLFETVSKNFNKADVSVAVSTDQGNKKSDPGKGQDTQKEQNKSL